MNNTVQNHNEGEINQTGENDEVKCCVQLMNFFLPNFLIFLLLFAV